MRGAMPARVVQRKIHLIIKALAKMEAMMDVVKSTKTRNVASMNWLLGKWWKFQDQFEI